MQIEWLDGIYNNNEYFLFEQINKSLHHVIKILLTKSVPLDTFQLLISLLKELAS